jgi:glutamine synthetase
MQEDGAGFAGFATWLDMTPAHPDMLAVPDPASVIQLPWKPEVAWVAANPVMEGRGGRAGPPQRPAPPDRGGRRAGAARQDRGGGGVFPADARRVRNLRSEYDTAAKPCYDQQAVMRRYDVVREICDYMLDLGWGPYQNDHEDANGQFEMNWEFDDALATADKHSFFKFMVEVGRREARASRDLHAETRRGADRERLPHTCVCLGRAGRCGKTNVFAIDPTPGSATSELGLSEQGRASSAGS